MRPTPDQYTYLSNAERHGGHLRQPHTLTTRMWMTAMVQMNKKGYIRWDGPRPFISERGRAAIENKSDLPDDVAGKDQCFPGLALVQKCADDAGVNHPD